ncbi:hypothetical protein [Aquipuribacter sp. SD81]|uniref:hypothetical protein n=1 Tax=Aquipuribacter sp. SD81 TaxID=3127703 RepID=UPI00301A5969
MAFAVFCTIVALLVGGVVLLLRPGTQLLVELTLGQDAPPVSDLRLLAGTGVAAVVVVGGGTVALLGWSALVPLLVAAAVGAVGAVAAGRALERPEVRRRLVRAELRAARRVTSLVRRAGEELAARRR